MNILYYLGIYEEAIAKAINVPEKALEECGISNTEFIHDIARDYMEENGTFQDITNSIIEAYFFSTAEIINEMYGEDSNIANYFVNCNDSHFYIRQMEITV